MRHGQAGGPGGLHHRGGPGQGRSHAVRLAAEGADKLVAFLASDDSRYMTGLSIHLDAGAMLKGGMSFS